MSAIQSILKLIFVFLMIIIIKPLHAQQSSADSIVNLIKKRNSKKGPDTKSFYSVWDLLAKTAWTDSNIYQIEAAADNLNKCTYRVYHTS